MVRLIPYERENLEVVERRLAFLSRRIATAGLRRRDHDVLEHNALLWMLEVFDHVVVNDCEEAIAHTNLRWGIVAKKRHQEEQRIADQIAAAKVREEQKAARRAAYEQRQAEVQAAAAKRREERRVARLAAALQKQLEAQAAAAKRREERNAERGAENLQRSLDKMYAGNATPAPDQQPNGNA